MTQYNATMSSDLNERFSLCRSCGEECVQNDDELRALLQDKANPVVNDVFEPSGRMHIAQGIVKVLNAARLLRAGCEIKILIARSFVKPIISHCDSERTPVYSPSPA